MGRLFKIVITLFFLMLVGYGIFFYQNNRSVPAVSQNNIAQSYERSVNWLTDHREEILHDGNSMLWWMLSESARISGDERIQQLVDKFHQDFDAGMSQNVWQSFFFPQRFRNATLSPVEYVSLVEYQQFFLYGLTCSRQLAQEPLIQAQFDPNFCWSGARIVRPACVTHQLMGYRIAKRNSCAIDDLDAKIAALDNTIVKQLTYDPRVVDVYIQRVLMLVDSGAGDRVKPRWIERVIAAQRADGGWSDMQPLISIGNQKYIGFGANGFMIGEPSSNFHATAQGILLNTLLLNRKAGPPTQPLNTDNSH